MLKKMIASCALLTATSSFAIPPMATSLIQDIIYSGTLQDVVDQEVRNMGPGQTLMGVAVRQVTIDRKVIDACGQAALSRSAAAVVVEMAVNGRLRTKLFVTPGGSESLQKCDDTPDSPFG